jgi:hypothetical protein
VGLLEVLPQSFETRFNFDAALISTIADEWSTGGVSLSSMILPRYSKEWGHLTCTLPISKMQGHTIDLILILGEDDSASIDLLDYSWLCHELAHNLHFQTRSFAHDFQRRLDDRMRGLQTRSVADRSLGRARSLARIERLASVWNPSDNQRNWAHEIAADLTALWVCGPAFLAAFQHLLVDIRPRPYHVNQEHPPYDVRVSALIDAAQRLQWNGDVDEMVQIQKTWRLSEHSDERTNDYLVLADNELITAAVTAALAVCDESELPRATPERVTELEGFMAAGVMPELGGELMIAAWIAENRLGEIEFDLWQAAVINELVESVTLECQ